LAGAVGAEEGHDLSLGDLEVGSEQDLDRPVGDLDLSAPKKGRRTLLPLLRPGVLDWCRAGVIDGDELAGDLRRLGDESLSAGQRPLSAGEGPGEERILPRSR